MLDFSDRTRTGISKLISRCAWIIAFNEAIEIINEYGVTGQGFADDCGPMIGGDNTHEMYKSRGVTNLVYSRPDCRVDAQSAAGIQSLAEIYGSHKVWESWAQRLRSTWKYQFSYNH